MITYGRCRALSSFLLRARRDMKWLILLCLLYASQRRAEAGQPSRSSFEITIAPQAGEDIAQPCRYRLELLSSAKVHGLFVIIERGPQSHRFFDDPDVRSFAKSHHLAMLMPFHCAAKKNEDMDVDPAKGLGRAFFTALDRLSIQSNHPEVAHSPLVFIGFSGAGVFAARMAAYAPKRTAAAVLSHAGQYPPLGLNTIELSREGRFVPELILVGGKDGIVGTESSYAYFHQNWLLGAPWLFATQNGATHCCTSDAKNLILNWLDAILPVRLHTKNSVPLPLQQHKGSYAHFQRDKTLLSDTVRAIDLDIRPTKEETPSGKTPAGWLPSSKTASAWLSLADQPPSSP